MICSLSWFGTGTIRKFRRLVNEFYWRKPSVLVKWCTATLINWSVYAKPGKWTVTILCFMCVDFASFCDFSIWFWRCSDRVVLFCFLFYNTSHFVSFIHTWTPPGTNLLNHLIVVYAKLYSDILIKIVIHV